MFADGLAPYGAKPSAGTMLTTKQTMLSSKFHGSLTHKQLETHVCRLSTVATDALVPKHQVIIIHNAD